MTKVLIGAPCGSNPRVASFYDCFYGLKGPEGSKHQRVTGGSLANNRNTLVRLAQEGGYSHLLFVDDDTMFSPDLLIQLLSHDKDVVSSHCLQKSAPFRPYIFDGMDLDGKFKFQKLKGETGLIKVLGVGIGGFLIKTSVFDKLPKPYFYTHYNGETEWWDDILFNKTLIENDVEIYCDLNATIFHATPASVAPMFKNGKWVTIVMIGDFLIELPGEV